MTAGHFDEYRLERRLTRHPKTVYCESVVIMQMFKWAKLRRMLDDNPLFGIRLDKPKLEPKGGPSLEEVNAILTLASEPLRSQLSVLAFTGARAGELQRLHPADVDLIGGWIHIRSRIGAMTKTKESRKVPIHPRLRPVLERILEPRKPWLYTAAPSTKYPDGGNQINTKRMNDQFARVVGRLGLPVGREAGYVIHSLRHFFETFCVHAGVPQRVIDTWLGHRGDKSMAAVYYRLRDEESLAFMSRVPFGMGAPVAETGEEIET